VDNKNTVKLSQLITWVKQEILSSKMLDNDPAPLFAIDEVILEVNFVIAGEVDGTIDLLVAKTDATVTEERVQKATIRMKSLVPPEKLSETLEKDYPAVYREIFLQSARVLLKGAPVAADPISEVSDIV
jgi:hypothetical protein